MLNDILVPQTVDELCKVENHAHEQALLMGDRVPVLARRRGVNMKRDAPGYQEQNWRSMLAFHQEYEKTWAKLHVNPEDTYLSFRNYLERIGRKNTVLAQISGSLRPPSFEKISNEDRLKAIGYAYEDAESETGIKAGFTANIVRDFGPDHAMWVIKEAIRLRDKKFPFITSIGMSGNENHPEPLVKYLPAIKLAHEAGLHCGIHAGETDIKNLIEAVDVLGEYLNQIDHGIHAVRDIRILDHYISKRPPRHDKPDKPARCVLTVCYFAYKLLNSWQDGPVEELLPALWKARFYLTPGSDDPGPFKIDIGDVYEAMHTKCGFSLEQLCKMTETGVEHSPLPDDVKKPLYAKVRRQCELLEQAGYKPVNDNRVAIHTKTNILVP